MFNENSIALSHENEIRISDYLTKVYAWMSFALAISALTAWQAAGNVGFMEWMLAHPAFFYGMMIGEILLVIALSGWVQKMSFAMAVLAFLAYAVMTGLTLSTIFLVYTAASIAKTFVITAGVFGAMSLYGILTKKDLTSWGSFCIMSLIGIILASLVNLFLHSHMIDWITTYAGIIVFTGLTAYDAQKLKYFGRMGTGNTLGNLAILGALTLYLDFINLFLYLLKVMGNRK